MLCVHESEATNHVDRSEHEALETGLKWRKLYFPESSYMDPGRESNY